MLSMSTDYSSNVHRFDSMQDLVNGVGNPQPYLQAIAEAGFSHVHWCHHWSGDFMYMESEVAYIDRLLQEYGLQVADVHGAEGREKFWYSPQEYARLAGVELVKNRIDFCARLGGDAVVMHAYPLPADPDQAEFVWEPLRKTLDALQCYAVERGIKIAIENLIDFPGIQFDEVPIEQAGDNRGLLQRIFENYPAEFVGLCYDSGHGNLGYDRLEQLENFLDRLIVLHLNGNDGIADQHHNLFVNPLDWERLAQLIAASVYDKPMSLETMASERDESDAAFLQTAFETGNRFAEMVAKQRAAT